ncbi:MAG: molybdopterin-binding protein [Nitrososphaerota archaeon]|nr:molybdopterin-binding protein [Nitrososphaerota archaeon]
MRGTVCEIIVIGNEILNGSIKDTNSGWLAARLHELGLYLRRITTVMDDVGEISGAIREAVRRGAKWIITSGGLGPTHDDITLEAVAKAAGEKLVINQEAVNMLKERYERLYAQGVIKDPQLTPARLKMALMPRGATPLRNNAGSAPGCLVKIQGATVVSLPGVPRELIDIFENEVKPRIEREAKRVHRASLWIDVKGVPESVYASDLEKISRALRGKVYMKSHPKGIIDGVSVTRIGLVSEGMSRESAEESLAKAEQMVRRMLERLGAVEIRLER